MSDDESKTFGRGRYQDDDEEDANIYSTKSEKRHDDRANKYVSKQMGRGVQQARQGLRRKEVESRPRRPLNERLKL